MGPGVSKIGGVNENPPPSYSTAEAARRLGVSAPTIQRWVDLGYLKAWKTVGGHRRVDAEVVDRFIADQRARAAPLPGGPAVLVVDDNPDDRDLLGALVEMTLPGAVQRVVENGFDALVEIGRAVPDILVADIVMPHMDGFEMLRHLASGGGPRPGSIIVVTSVAPERLAAFGEWPLPVQVVHKPIDGESFAAALRRAAPAAARAGL